MATDRRAHPLTINPSRLDTHGRCLLEYRTKYLEKNWGDNGYAPSLSLHNVTHAVLRSLFERFRREGAFPPIHLMALIAAEQLRPKYRYPDQATRDAEASRILMMVQRGLTWFDGAGSIEAVERDLEFAYPGSPDCPAFLLTAKPDLIRELPDGTIETVDWKTGGFRENEQQQALARIVIAAVNPDRVIRSTTVFLATAPEATVETMILPDATVRSWWKAVKTVARDLETRQAWPATSHPFCSSCPLYHQGCPLYPAAPDPRRLLVWLEDDDDETAPLVGVATAPRQHDAALVRSCS